MGDTVKSNGEIHACESIFLGKKSYIDRLRDDEGNEAFHIRLKGIPSKCIQAKTAEAYGGDPMKLYTDLFEGKEVEFDLESGGNCVFKTNKDHSICTGSMKRKVCFCSGPSKFSKPRHALRAQAPFGARGAARSAPRGRIFSSSSALRARLRHAQVP